MLVLINFVLLSVSQLPSADTPWDNWNQDQDFNFYLGEFIENKFDEGSPYQILVEQRLAEATMNTKDEKTFKERLSKIQTAYRKYPDHMLRFQRLDERLQLSFDEKLRSAKRIRWISATGGALVGALIAIPVGKSLGSKLAGNALIISVPIGALSGAALGFLLSDLLAMPSYHYDDLGISSDIEMGLSEIENVLEGEK